MKPKSPKGTIAKPKQIKPTSPPQPKMVNPTASASFVVNSPKVDRKEIQKLSKQIDRVRKSIKRLEDKAPNAPALLRAKQFMATHNITSVSQTKWIKTVAQYREFKQFLNRYETYTTRTVKGAKAAQVKQMNKLEEIMRANGWDPSMYSVEDFYKQLNKLDIYTIMADYGVYSDTIISDMAILMNTTGGKKVTANKLLTQIFGTPVTTPQGSSKYTKGTKANISYKSKRKRS